MTEFFKDPGIRDAIFRKQLVERQNGHPEGSVLSTFAEMIVAEGSQGLRSLSSKMGKNTINEASQTNSLVPLQRALSPKDMGLLFESFTAVLTGVTIQTLETAAQTEEIDIESWVAKYNQAISGVFFPAYKYTGDAARDHLKTQAAHVKKYIDRDQTCAVFFEDYFNVMPDILKQAIFNHTYYKYLNFESFISKYKLLATSLLAEPTRQDESVATSNKKSLLDAVYEIAGKRWEEILDEDNAAARWGCGCLDCAHRALKTKLLIEKPLLEKTAADDS